jgi:hypothetical protein
MPRKKKTVENAGVAVSVPQPEKVTFRYGDMDIEVTPVISLDETAQCVADIVTPMFADTGETVEYLPFSAGFLTDIAVLRYFTNVDLSGLSAAELWLLAASELPEKAAAHISKKALRWIETGVRESVEFRKSLMLADGERLVQRLAAATEAQLEQMEKIQTDLAGAMSAENMQDILSAVERLGAGVNGAN